ncbi:MAG: glycosyltransferase family 9 protein [Nibricoccus sp.]
MPAPSNVPSILIIRRRYLGDIVLLGPVLKSLRNHWPEAKLTVMVDPAFAPILSLNPDADKVFFVPSSLAGWWKTFFQLRRSRFTHVLDLDNRPRSAWVVRLSRAPVRVALHHGGTVVAPGAYTHHAIASDNFFKTHHITDYYGHALKQIGVPFESTAPKLVPRQEDFDFVRRLPVFTQPSSATKILIHPGSRSPHRIWPADRFAAVIAQFQTNGLTPILVAGPGEKNVVADIQSRLPMPAAAVDQRLTIPQLAALFVSADTLLCHDSGPMHLAAAVGTPVVALFSSQSVTAWRPFGEQHITLQAPMPCNPCLSPNFCVPSDSYHNHCVRHLSIEQVFNAVRQQIINKAK